MLSRRNFLHRSLGASSLLATGTVIPEFLARTATAAEESKKSKDTILVVIEMTGGNDGLNMVVPYADDLYHKARPTLAFRKNQVLALNDQIGLHQRMNELKSLYDQKSLAVLQGIGYPNPDRSHFESMDIWQLGDPKRQQTTGWLSRSISGLTLKDAGVPGMYLGEGRLPVALQGADGGVVSLSDRRTFKLQLTGPDPAKRKTLLEELNAETGKAADLAAFVRKRQLQTYTSLQRIEEALKEAGGNDRPQPNPEEFNPNRGGGFDPNSLEGRMDLIARLIKKGLGTRIYYAGIDGFDTHSRQADPHAGLMGQVSGAIARLLNGLKENNEADRVIVLTYSEFGRRVKENGSRGTDHGAASCMFVAGPKVEGGILGKHPALDDLTDGDLKYHTDFRRVYATLLDNWLGVDSRGVLGDKFDHLPLIKKA